MAAAAEHFSEYARTCLILHFIAPSKKYAPRLKDRHSRVNRLKQIKLSVQENSKAKGCVCEVPASIFAPFCCLM